ncbi:MAG: flagellar assembly protein FliW [Solirubrobacteraceae bacterium]|jgi:flagellar assembly factor FliW
MTSGSTTEPMTITLDSSRFGRVEIKAEAAIEFPEGLIGLGGSRYALLGNSEDSPFVWLHSLDDGGLALPVTNPNRFFAGYRIELDEDEAQRLEIDETTPIDVYVTVRAAPVLTDFVANLRAPIIIHNARGYQVINQAAGSELQARLFPLAGDTAAPSLA